MASRTIRVTEIAREVDEWTFLEVAERLSSRDIRRGWFPSAIPGSTNPVNSFAPQFEGSVGTITLPSERHKTKALKNNDTGWIFDDGFNEMTVLYSSADEPDIE